MKRAKQTALLGILALAIVVPGRPTPMVAEEGVIAGVDVGVAVPIKKLNDRENVGGSISPFAGYMFNDYLGLMGAAQFTAFPYENREGITDKPMGLLAGTAGPRLALPLGPVELYGTWQGGVFTGLHSNTPSSRTSWGYSTGGGINVRVSDQFLVGGYARYHWVDQRIEHNVANPHSIQYVTTGISLTYNPLAPPEPAPVVAQPAPKPEPKPAPIAKKIVLRGVNFDFDKSNIRADARPVLDEAIATLKQEGGIAVIAEGHTDGIGSDAYNQKLSAERAEAVRDYLVKGGISANRIKVEGLGESRPVANNATTDGRAQNRRVELRVLGN